MPDYRKIESELVRALARDRVSSSPEIKVTHGYDASRLRGKPDVVCWPFSTDEVSAICKVASAHGAPIVARGAASGLTGGCVPEHGGIVVDFLRMNRVLSVDPVSGCAVVEPGILVDDFQAHLAPKGMFYAPDPGSSAYATIGGNIAENAGGMRAVKYGVTRDSVLALTCVLADGSVIRTGSRAHKCVAGFDLTRLICGSEGMLALITEAALKIIPLPKFTATVLAGFDSEGAALTAAAHVCSEGALPRALEFADRKCIEVITGRAVPLAAASSGEPPKPIAPAPVAPLIGGDWKALILAETDGATRESADAEMALVKTVMEKYGARSIFQAADASERTKIWSARKTLASALYNVAPVKLNEDIAVPRAALAEFVAKSTAEAEKRGLFFCNYGHVGDGNLHATVMLPDDRTETRAPAEELVAFVFRLALDLGGTISGEHGIGMTKRPFLSWEIGEAELDLMRRIKSLFDPQGILNPGKQFPAS
jgi:FAD/FMN-containing dehydrogenase